MKTPTTRNGGPAARCGSRRGLMAKGLALTLSPGLGRDRERRARACGPGRPPRAWPRRAHGQAPAGRLAAEVRYGVLALFDTGVVTPYAGTMLAVGADRTYRLGTRVQVPGRGASGLTLTVEGTRQEPAGGQPLNQGLRFELSWSF